MPNVRKMEKEHVMIFLARNILLPATKIDFSLILFVLVFIDV